MRSKSTISDDAFVGSWPGWRQGSPTGSPQPRPAEAADDDAAAENVAFVGSWPGWRQLLLLRARSLIIIIIIIIIVFCFGLQAVGLRR